MMSENKYSYSLLGIGAALMLGACSTTPPQTGLTEDLPTAASSKPAPAGSGPAAEDSAAVAGAEKAETPTPRPKETYPGTGLFINPAPTARPPSVRAPGGDVTLNFAEATVQEVAKVVLGDILKQNYAIDPGVKGTVSLQTSRPIARTAILPMLEIALRMNGAALIQDQGLYRIAPLSNAPRGSLAPRSDERGKLGPGYQIQVVPLRFIAAAEMQKILEPFVGEGGVLKVDERRNLLILAGSSQELRNWLATVEMFDVDWLKGHSVGLFHLEYAEAKTVAEELGRILAGKAEGRLGEVIRIEPLDRLNAVLVISPQVRYIEEMRTWVERLDRAGGGSGAGLYVYQARNRKAAELASVLGSLFSGQKEAAVGPEAARLAPGLEPVRLESPETRKVGGPQPGQIGSSAVAGTAGLLSSTTSAGLLSSTTPAATPARPVAPAVAQELSLPGGGVRIMADEPNNSVLVLADAMQYKIIESALKRMDQAPLQVLIEASIIEVSLGGDLSYGLEWFFKNNSVSSGKTGIGKLDLREGAGIGPVVPGFSYTLVGAADTVHAVLNALASETQLNVLSSPSLMVLDNRKAKIRVGEQVPVSTSVQVASSTLAFQSYQFKDTGVALAVSPRVNAGGLVSMEINQEVTDLGAVEATTNQRKFLQRSIESVVGVHSGQTIVLGGLIMEKNSNSESGIPGLYRIPLFGKLFGMTEEKKQRTELLVLITPKVVRNQQDASDITEEFRKRLKTMQQQKGKDAAKEESGA